MKKMFGLLLVVLLAFNSCKEKDNPVTITDPTLPVVLTSDVYDVNSFAAKSGGSVTSDGGSPVIEKGICWDVNPSPQISSHKTKDGSAVGAFYSDITDLTPRTKYYVRAYATNSVGTAYGKEINFTSVADLPKLTTVSVTLIKQITAKSGGTITSEGEAAITSKGICWSTNSTPTILDSKTTDGDGISNFTSQLTDLTSNTKYYVRAYATNDFGTGYGNEISFTTREDTLGTVVDTVGNVYKTVKIGNQWWMAENLRTTKYRNGSDIVNVTDSLVWSGLKTAAYCYNKNNVDNGSTYGALYNWYAVNDARKLAPKGWHIATDEEWSALVTFLGLTPGTKLKSKTGWTSGNGIDSYGFSALPGGNRGNGGVFENIGTFGFWWSSTELTSTNNAWFRYINNANPSVDKNYVNKSNGYSIRCVKD